MDSETRALRDWYNSYMAADGNRLSENDPLVQDVISDTLDEASIEQRICQYASDMHLVNRLCDGCRDMFENWPFRNYSSSELALKDANNDLDYQCRHARVRIYHTVAIEASARCGCRFCAFLLQLLKDQELLHIFRRIEARLERLGERAETSLSVWVEWAGTETAWLDLPSKMSTYCSSGLACASIICEPSEEADCANENEGIFDIANLWLRTCLESHDSCNSATENHQLPTRLVSIATDPPRVVITADCGDVGGLLKYATLSYCWGSRPFLRLKKHNLPDLKEGKDMNSLPSTFTDAFKVAKKLGISYIWIDSLCIVQDDDDDWRREADLMQHVYSGSYINIAAASATDAYGGCLIKSPYFNDRVQVEVTTEGTRAVKEFSYPGFYQRSILDSRLMTRGWAIQEKLLPPRTIHLGNRGAIWECTRMVMSESCPRTTPTLLGRYLVCGQTSGRYAWSEIVKAYSAANLTKRRDKIPALIGIARAVADFNGGVYVAGLWKQNIEEQLCWHSIGGQNTRKRPLSHGLDWIAPSWSWASIDGLVGFSDDPGIQRYTKVFKADRKLSEPRLPGQPNHGVLYLRCAAIVPGRLRKTAAPGCPDSDFTESATIGLLDGTTLVLPVLIDCREDCQELDDQTIYLIPLSNKKVWRFKPEQGDGGWEYDHLGIVGRKTNHARGEFCRIGVFRLTEPQPMRENDIDFPSPVLWQILDQISTATAEAVCAEVISITSDPKARKYVITLV
ncbi:hypothetical protein PG999_012295 [Apiospora kogelbergensis]|uniref:Heterokaryon incompatibility domain-containing protein n=1 Tax=Apiospora kogelbergensis TaxID=1337665 RepID=A0AAW0QJP6_9PEZI